MVFVVGRGKGSVYVLGGGMVRSSRHELAEVFEDNAEVVVSCCKVGLQTYGGLIGSAGSLQIPLGVPDPTEVVVRQGKTRLPAQRFLVRCHGGGRLAMLHQHMSQAVIEMRQVRLAGDSLPNECGSERMLAALAGEESETVQRLGMLRHLLEDRTIEGLSLRQCTMLVIVPGLL